MKDELPYYDQFIMTDQHVRELIRKGLKKKSREYYFVKAIDKLGDGKYLIRLEQDFKM